MPATEAEGMGQTATLTDSVTVTMARFLGSLMVLMRTKSTVS